MSFRAVCNVVNKKERYQAYDFSFYFDSLKELYDKIEEHIFIDCTNHKKNSMYLDTPEGTVKAGFIMSYWDHYDDTGKRFNAEVWVSLFNCEPLCLSDLKAVV